MPSYTAHHSIHSQHEYARVSIVICTDGRPKALEKTLQCLQFLDGMDYEVCVVRGPTEDGIEDVLKAWEGHIKVAKNPERNLSVSRNLGIALSSGEIVAFIDDDGMPEHKWLVDLLRAFEDPRVGAAGGIVMDHTGTRAQYLYSSANRLGNADWQRSTPADVFNFPFSYNFPYLQGTNSAFRRDILLAIGGFDEEYEFYLDETDLCCRINDDGWLIRQLPDAVVHHKFLPSEIRTADRVTRVRYSVLKNKLYFSLVNNRGHYTTQRAVEDMASFVSAHAADVRYHIDVTGMLSAGDLEAFERDAERAWEDGLKRGFAGRTRMMDVQLASLMESSFLPFPRRMPEGGRNTFAFLSQEYPPETVGGVGRYINQLARAIASMGHIVHVLTRGSGHDRVDFEDGVWVHRLASQDRVAPAPYGIQVPSHIWEYSSLMLDELHLLSERQKIDAVYAPIWDCEGVAILLDGQYPMVTGLQTTLHFWLISHPHFAADPEFMNGFAKPILALEARILQESNAIHAISAAIRSDISEAYNVVLDDTRTSMIPLGLEDFSTLAYLPPPPVQNGDLRILFVGRLERRKGIDVLLDIIPSLLTRHPFLHFDIVGNDAIPGPDGVTTYRAAFEAASSEEVRTRVRFYGEVTEEQLRGFYRSCDIFVAPSRFESFGQIFVEAMIFGKPTLGCRAGGMMEVIEPDKTGLLAEPGDPVSLSSCLDRLISSPSLRASFGENGRHRYEQLFSIEAAANSVAALLRNTAKNHKIS